MCAVTHRAKPFQLTRLIKKSVDEIFGTQLPMKPLYNTCIEIFITLLSMFYLQKVLLINVEMCILHYIYYIKIAFVRLL